MLIVNHLLFLTYQRLAPSFPLGTRIYLFLRQVFLPPRPFVSLRENPAKRTAGHSSRQKEYLAKVMSLCTKIFLKIEVGSLLFQLSNLAQPIL